MIKNIIKILIPLIFLINIVNANIINDFKTELNSGNMINDLKANFVCTAIKLIPKETILSSQKLINNKINLPKRINEDMIMEKVTIDRQNSAIIYNIKCSEYVDDMYIKVYLKKLQAFLFNNKAIICLFNKGIRYKYVFYRIENGKRKVLAIRYFPY